MKKHFFHFWCTSFLSCVYFISIYIQHNGVDNTFKFEWLGKNASTAYIPVEAVEGMCQIFNLDGDAGAAQCCAACSEMRYRKF